MFKSAKKAAKAAKSAGSLFSTTRQASGTFAAIGTLGRRSSGGKSAAQLARSGKIRSAIVAGGIVGTTTLGSRRGSGTGRSTGGRPTGIRKY